MSEPQLLIVEDLPELRAQLARLLEEERGPGVVCEAGDVASGRAMVDAHPTLRLVLVDLGLPDGSGIELVRHVVRTRPEALAVVLSIFDDDAHVFSALEAGAHGYLLKEAAPERCLEALRRLEEGMPPLSPSVARRILRSFQRPAIVPTGASATLEDVHLSKRETEVLSYIGRGLRVIEVAQLLGLTENTVAGYVKTIYRKLEVSSRAEAALEAARRGLT